jgi:hypothetical protein
MVDSEDNSFMIDLTKLKYKKNQHYVSKFYLEQWLADGRLFVKRTEGDEFTVFDKRNGQGIGTERYFYGIQVDGDVLDTLNHMFAEKSLSNKAIEIHLQRLTGLKLLDDVINKEIGIVNRDEKLLENVKEAFRHMNLHHLEDSYEKIETAISVEIKKFTNSALEESWHKPTYETAMSIFLLFGTQLFRSKEKMAELQSLIPEIHVDRNGVKKTLTSEQRDTVLKLMVFFHAQEFSSYLEKSGCSVTITRNFTDLGYLTSDSPSLMHTNPPPDLELLAYGAIPLSPWVMAHIHFPKVIGTSKELKVIDVHDAGQIIIANKVIINNPHSQLYASRLEDFVRSGVDIADYTEPAKDSAE